MEIVKKNLISIICGVIAILAIAAIPTVIRSQQKALQTRLADHKKTYDALRGLQSQQRRQPVVSADPNAAVPDLPGFPGPKVIESGKAAISKVQAQSLELEKLATEMNKHNLLVPTSLPNPSETFTFQRDYQEALDKGISTKIQSVTPPTQAEIDAQKLQLKQRLEAEAKRNEKGEMLFKDQVEVDIAKQVAELPEVMRQNAASKYKMYMAAATALDRSASMSGGGNGMTQLPPEEIWLAQLGLWVQQDVTDAIRDANSKSTSVATSPVKELVVIEIPHGREIYAIPGSGGATPAPMGQATASNVPATGATDPLKPDFAVSPTGRTCNGVFDVVHFTVCMNVDASEVNRIIQQLQKGRLLTVYHSDVNVVNSLEKQQEGYFYGPVPVVTLTLRCEELYMRSWTRPLMPQPIKQYLNVQEAPPAQATAN
jgi:hypothetical protein